MHNYPQSKMWSMSDDYCSRKVQIIESLDDRFCPDCCSILVVMVGMFICRVRYWGYNAMVTYLVDRNNIS